MNQNELFSSPLRTLPTRVRRTYCGGEWFSQWHQKEDTYGNTCPEEWLASSTEAINTGFTPVENEGLSCVQVDGQTMLLRDLIQQAPEQMLGEKHAAEYGANQGVLAKIIDSAERLSIQVHPDHDFSERWFHSRYGKTECWYIMDAHNIGNTEPYLLMGFRPGVTREQWEEYFNKQDIEGMIGCLQKIKPKAGEVWLVRGGVPHAIGPGCCLVEIQEPTDYTLRSEVYKSDGTRLPDELVNRCLGNEALMQCFHYTGMTEEELREDCCISPVTNKLCGDDIWQLLIGEEHTPCFSMDKATIKGSYRFTSDGGFSFAAILEGSGTIEWEGKRMELNVGDQLFLPAGLKNFTLSGNQDTQLTWIRFYPPGSTPKKPEQK